MKVALRFLSLSILLMFSAYLHAGGDAAQIAVGDERETVIEILGPPKGAIGSETFKILYYDRGNVYLRNGIVERTDLISAEEAEAARIAREERREAERLRAEMERRDRIDEGRAIKAERLADESFLNRPSRDRLAFWRTFSRHYPEIDVSFQLDVARAEFEEDQREREWEERRERERLAIEQRIRDAEARAAQAEERAQRIQEERERAQRERVYRPSPVYIIQPAPEPDPDHKAPDTSTDRPREHRVHTPDRPAERERIVPERRQHGDPPQENSPTEGSARLSSR